MDNRFQFVEEPWIYMFYVECRSDNSRYFVNHRDLGRISLELVIQVSIYYCGRNLVCKAFNDYPLPLTEAIFLTTK